MADDLLRWRADPISFIETCLYDPETGQPFKLLAAEREFLQHAFKTDADGRLLYPEQAYCAIKKSGKTACAAMILLTMLLLYGGKFAEGYCLASSREQAQSRVFQAARRIVECSPLLKREAKITQDKIVFTHFDDATIFAISSEYSTSAGANPTISCFDELWTFDTERDYRLWDEMVPPPTRKITCRLTVSYAGFSGDSVLLETLYKRGLQQPQIGNSLFAGDGLLMAWHHFPIAPWQDERWLADMRRSLRPNQYLRMIENRFVTSESSFVDMAKWDACVHPDCRPVVTDKSMYCWVGVDASHKHDSTAIVGVTFGRKSKQVRVVFDRVFRPTPDKPLQFEATIEATLKELSHRFQFQKVLFDPWQMQAVAQRLTATGLPVEEFPQTSGNLTAASQNLYELVEGGNLVLYPDANMRLAASRAIAVETSRGWRISKEKQSHKIDVIVALAMACHAAVRGSSAPYYDRSYSAFQPDADDDDKQPSFAVEELRSAILSGYGWRSNGGRWQ